MIDDRLIGVLRDAGWPSSLARMFVASGVTLKETRYSEEAALAVLRDAADAEFPAVADLDAA